GEGDPPRVLGPLARGQGPARPLARPEPRNLSCRPPRRLPRRLRPGPPRAAVALLLRLPEPPLEPDARPRDRASDPPRAACRHLVQGRAPPDPPRPRLPSGRRPVRLPPPPSRLAHPPAPRGPGARSCA